VAGRQVTAIPGDPQPPGSVSAVAEAQVFTGSRPSRVDPCPVDVLASLLGAEPVRGETAALTVTGVAFDSRTIQPGDLYLGLPGARTHGARFARAAVSAGATAILTDAEGAELAMAEIGDALPVLVVADPRRAMARAAAEVYGRPATKLIMFGITGTNGKTTTSCLLSAGLRAAGRRCGMIGTLGYFVDDTEIAVDRTTITTPESADLQALLAIMVEQGAEAVVMEVSSHALALGRADEIVFDVAGFTNFGRDHLDFHRTVEAYFEAKAQLFTAERARRAVINIDDDRGPELLTRAAAAGLPVASTSLGAGAGDDDLLPAHDRYRCLSHEPAVDPVPVRLATPQGELDFRLGLPGTYNVANAITALAMIEASGIDAGRAAGGLLGARVPGRLQRVDLGANAPRAYVDFAHTPQAVRSVLSELAVGVGGGRLICVVGCGGDRDPDKRAPMGAVAAELSDLLIITDDNPRSEDPAAIRAAVLAGARQQAEDPEHPVTVIDGGDRAAAIRLALAEAGPADVIALLGKGHERGQQIGDRIVPFDDVEQLVSGWAEGSQPSERGGRR
jgi:UDP-N-acetylmuramoyl-L-alanyl-D-glutamate--2,6-diaminopimelate ligase